MKKILMIGLTLTVAFTSCKKKGCTDTDSLNYDSSAKKDDGSCSYEGNIEFWWNESTSLGLQNDGATSISVYVNGTLIGSSGTDVYHTGNDCGDNVGIESTFDYGSNKTYDYTYEVKDQTGFVYWKSTGTYSASLCESIQLTW